MYKSEILPALQFTPPVIVLNFEELEVRISEITDQYQGLVVRDEDVPSIKSELAALNSLARQLSDARKEAVARVAEPIREFEERVKAMEKQILGTRALMDEQVKAHIKRERDGKRHAVQVMVDALVDEHGLTGSLVIPMQESWLNKTAKDKQIMAEILAMILKHKKEQEEKAAFEQAKIDRAIAIENHNKALASGHDYALPLSGFMALHSLEIPLDEALKRIDEAYAAENKRIAQNAIAVNSAPTVTTLHFTDMPEIPVPKAVTKPVKGMTITATYSPENGPAITELYRQLKMYCLTITAKVERKYHEY